MRRLLALEERLGLFELRIAAAPAWEYLRLPVFYELLRARGGLAITAERPRRTPLDVLRLSWGAARAAMQHPIASAPSDVVFFGFPRKVRTLDGAWCDPFVDPLLVDLPATSVYVEQRHRRRLHGRARRTRTIAHDYFDVRAAVRNRVAPLRLRGCELTALRLLERELKHEFQVRMDLASLALRLLRRRTHLIEEYISFLSAAAAKLLVVVSPNCNEQAAIEAARSLGIRTAELQHGVIAPLDPAYSVPASVDRQASRADDLLLFDDYWRRTLQNPGRSSTLRTIGFAHQELAVRELPRRPKSPQVVFLSQPTIGRQLSQFAVEFAKRSQFAGCIVYRLHPDEANWRKSYPWLTDAGIEIEDERAGPLYERLATSTAQVGVYSFALFEGLRFGLPTYLVDLPGVEACRGLLDEGRARLIRSVDEIVAAEPVTSIMQTASQRPVDAVRRFHEYVGEVLAGAGAPALPAPVARSA